MADPWELILHHTYTGTPGVIFDQSPGRGGHGVAVGLSGSDFLTDGASAGSGAIDFSSGGRVRVVAPKKWSPLNGIRVELLCYRDVLDGSLDHILEGGNFRLIVRGDLMRVIFDSGSNHYFLSRYGTPAQEWMTIGFTYDGLSTAELSLNGVIVDQRIGPLLPIDATQGLLIGGAGSLGFAGRIDELKMWRVNPHRADSEFTGRPVDESVKDCWAQWTRGVGEALRKLSESSPECPARIRYLLSRAVAGVVRDGLTHSDASATRWHKTSDAYRQLWSQGQLEDIVPLTADLLTWLQLEGLDPARNPDALALFNDACWQRLVELAPPLDCDPQFTEMVRDLVKTVEMRERHRYLDKGSGA